MTKRRFVCWTILISIVAITLCGCGDDKSVENTADPLVQIIIEDIDSIGEVTIEDEQLISKLLSRYDVLTDDQKELITNYTVLTNAQNKLETLKKEAEEAAKAEEQTEEEPIVEEKDPWDLTGSWCTESVENGEPGMAAYITDDKMTIYHVSDISNIYSPYRVGTYEVQKGKDTFSWTSTNDLSKETDYPLYSYDETKDFTYKDGIISFARKSNNEEVTIDLHRTDLDFSSPADNNAEGVNETATLGFFDYKIPKSFGFYREDRDDGIKTLTYISDKAILRIGGGINEEMKVESLSDSQFKTMSDEIFRDEKNKFLKDNKGSELIEESEESIAGCFGHTAHISGVEWDGMIGDVYFAQFWNQYSKGIGVIICYVAHDATYDYGSDFKELISDIKANPDLTKNTALSKLNKKEDEVTKITYYFPKNYPEYIDKKTYVLPYVATRDDEVELHLKLNYCDRDWVFWHTVIFAIDDERYEMQADPLEINTNVSRNGKVFETYDKSPLTPADIGMLRRIAKAEKVIIRFQGDDYRYDHTLADEDKQAFTDVLAAYDAIKQSL